MSNSSYYLGSSEQSGYGILYDAVFIISTNHAGFVWFSIFNQIFWVNLIFLEDDKNRGIEPRIHTAVIRSRRAAVTHTSFNIISNQDSGYKHYDVFGITLAISVCADGIFCEVIPWK